MGLVPETPVTVPYPFPLKDIQSAEVRDPFDTALAVDIEIAGVAPPELAIGGVPETEATPALPGSGDSPAYRDPVMKRRIMNIQYFIYLPSRTM